jgi:hypothetical protein
MKLRVIEILLILAIIPGAFLAWRTGGELSELRAEYSRLAGIVGDFQITDPTKVHVRALPTGDKLHFAWRFYLPPKYRLVLRSKSGGSSMSTRSDAHEFIGRIRLTEDEQGILQIHTKFSGGSSRGGYGDRELLKFLRDRWDRIQVEQLGATEIATIEPSKSAMLLKLSFPQDLEKEAREVLPRHSLKNVPVLFQMELGPAAGKP